MKNKSRVIALMSGGVDSSVAAALLKDQGHEVVGVYILGWQGEPDFPCNWQREEADARSVAQKLGIPFCTVNLAQEYEQAVVNQFFAGYQAGVTPNPDILCNKEVKFKALWQAVRQFEPDFVATGHYARMLNPGTTKAVITKPADGEKDQTYFLWGIDPKMLPNILFPLGEYKKSQVRQLAKQHGLPTASKKDSQGICFIGPLKLRAFLRRHISTQPGPAYLADGRQIATHQGSHFYTIGQRLAPGSVSWTGDAPPLYVLAKDTQRNILVVGHDHQVTARHLTAYQSNWFVAPLSREFVCQAKIRYRQEDISAIVTISDTGLEVRFAEGIRAITAGQSIVFYDQNKTLLGGAIIRSIPAQDDLVAAINAHVPVANQSSQQKTSSR